MIKRLRGDAFLGLVLAFAAFLVYLVTLSPSVIEDDCGELAAALYTRGIPHPTGYPLFTLTGWAFSHLPLGGTPIWRLNLMVALLCAASVYLFFRLFLFLSSEKGGAVFGGRGFAGKPDRVSDRLAAAVAALVLAFSRTFWSESVSLEVYALHLVFLAAVTLLFLRALAERARASGPAADRAWIAFAFVLGLSFSNHMMTVLLAPAFLWLYFSAHGTGRLAWTKIGRAVIPFLAGLSPYLYLPLRSAQGPAVNWGDPSTPARFWWHVSGGQYHFKMFTTPDVAFRKSAEFFSALPSEFGYAPLALGALGLWVLYRRDKKLLLFSALVFLGCLIYAVNYDFEDPNFYLNAYAALAVWILWGARALLAHAAARGWRRPAWILCGAFVLFPLCLNRAGVDRSGDYAVEDYARNVLAPLDSGAVLLTNGESYFTAPSLYLQWVAGVRSDVVVADRNLLPSPWYQEQLERLHPGLIPRPLPVGDEARSFLRDIYGVRPVYVTTASDTGPAAEFGKVPSGLAFRLFRGPLPASWPPAYFSFRPFPRSTPAAEEIRNGYVSGYANQALYRLQQGDTAGAIAFFRRALDVRPGFPPVLDWLRRLGGIR